jgi:Fe-S oxidoreductase
MGRLAAEHRVDLPVDRARAEILYTVSATEIEKYPKSIVATARIMKRLGADWTLRSDGYQANNYGLYAGDVQKQKEASVKLIDAAVACGAKTLILPECGHAYGALRWQGANLYGKPLPFKVLHISEFLADSVRGGKLKLKRVGKTATFHDPCQSSRRGGVTEAPREVLTALGVELKEMFPTKGTNWCCGGGGGVVDIKRADALRHKVFHLKMSQIDDTGAELPVTSCVDCRQTFDDGQAHTRWDKSMNSLLELVADNLIEA